MESETLTGLFEVGLIHKLYAAGASSGKLHHIHLFCYLTTKLLRGLFIVAKLVS
jgi:hypothetical protein